MTGELNRRVTIETQVSLGWDGRRVGGKRRRRIDPATPSVDPGAVEGDPVSSLTKPLSSRHFSGRSQQNSCTSVHVLLVSLHLCVSSTN
jgi:hypothetical protein